MNIARKIGLTLATTLVSVGLLGITAPAHADTSWGCGGYCVKKPGTGS